MGCLNCDDKLGEMEPYGDIAGIGVRINSIPSTK